jgi:hypothetical protein
MAMPKPTFVGVISLLDGPDSGERQSIVEILHRVLSIQSIGDRGAGEPPQPATTVDRLPANLHSLQQELCAAADQVLVLCGRE